MGTITLTINGKNITCPAGSSILSAAANGGIRIPTLCHHPDLAPHGACRLCLVEDEASGRLMASCVTPAAPGMTLRTDSPAVLGHRRNIVRLMMAEHPESCLVCSKGNRCGLRRIAAELGVGESGLYPMPNYKPLEQANPFITRDLSKCILCGKCIRADHELVVVGAIDYNLRGFGSRPTTLHERPLEASNCTFCGTCVSMCPTGALAPSKGSFVGTPEKETETTCGFCAVGCALSLGTAGGQVVEANPAGLTESVNRATLCVRGHFAHDYLSSPSRLKSPLIRRDGELAPASWEEALGVVAERLMAIKRESGPQSLAFWGSAQCTNEENYLFQKLARTVLGTGHIDTLGSLSGARAWQLIEERSGGGLRRQPFSRIEAADAVLLVGTDLAQTLPVMSYFVKRAVKKGAVLVTAGMLPAELDRFATLSIPLKPGRHLEFLSGLLACLALKDGYNPSYIDRHTKGFLQLRQELLALDLKGTCRRCGVSRSILEQAAEMLKGKRIAAVAGQELLCQESGPAGVDALFNLLLMTAGIGADGAGLFLETPANNTIGAWDMGMAPDFLPGRAPLTEEKERRRWEKGWKCRLSPDPGAGMLQSLSAAAQGNLKGLYIMGENPLRSLPQSGKVREALAMIDFVVVQDIVRTETAEIADVVLPGAPFAEKAGSFTNLEGRIQSFDPVTAPVGEARPDWEILAGLAARMTGLGEPPTLETVRQEIRRLIPMYADLGKPGMPAWVRPHTGRRPFHPEEKGEKIPFTTVISRSDGLPESHEYPYTAVLVSPRFHMGSGTRTSLSPRMRAVEWSGAVRISASDCQRLRLDPGSRVRVVSAHGSVTREIRLDADLCPGMIKVPLAFNGNDAMGLCRLSLARRQETPPGPPGRTCRVRIEAVE